MVNYYTTNGGLCMLSSPQNLGHGIDALTPEENAKYFVDCCVQWNQRK